MNNDFTDILVCVCARLHVCVCVMMTIKEDIVNLRGTYEELENEKGIEGNNIITYSRYPSIEMWE